MTNICQHLRFKGYFFGGNSLFEYHLVLAGYSYRQGLENHFISVNVIIKRYLDVLAAKLDVKHLAG